LRVVDELEERYAQFRGLNLTFETREGILKHCSPAKAAELGELGRRFQEKRQPSLEAQLTNLSDEIAYNSHDVDDGLRAGLLTLEQLTEIQLFREQYEDVRSTYPALSERRAIHEVVRRMINRQVVDLVETSLARLASSALADSAAVRNHSEALIVFSPSMREQNLELKRFLRNNLYRHYRVHRMTAKAARVINALFGAFIDDVRLLPPDVQRSVADLEQQGDRAGRARGVADYIAGMTDRYAIAEYHRVFDPGQLS
jgi:dGTPase